jgi:hypothetical protein
MSTGAPVLSSTTLIELALVIVAITALCCDDGWAYAGGRTARALRRFGSGSQGPLVSSIGHGRSAGRFGVIALNFRSL